MKLSNANSIINEVSGHSYSWLAGWGLSTIKEAIYTIFHRGTATQQEREEAERVEHIILSK